MSFPEVVFLCSRYRMHIDIAYHKSWSECAHRFPECGAGGRECCFGGYGDIHRFSERGRMISCLSRIFWSMEMEVNWSSVFLYMKIKL